MSQLETIADRFPKLKKNMLNVVLFLGSIAAVVAILTRKRELNLVEFAGTVIVVGLCYLVLYLFLLQFRHEVLRVSGRPFLYCLQYVAFLLITRLVLNMATRNIIFLVPFAVIPVIIRTFYDARLALFILLITIMLAGFMVPEPFKFILMSFISGMVAIFTLTNNFRKSRLFFTSLW